MSEYNVMECVKLSATVTRSLEVPAGAPPPCPSLNLDVAKVSKRALCVALIFCEHH